MASCVDNIFLLSTPLGYMEEGACSAVFTNSNIFPPSKHYRPLLCLSVYLIRSGEYWVSGTDPPLNGKQTESKDFAPGPQCEAAGVLASFMLM